MLRSIPKMLKTVAQQPTCEVLAQWLFERLGFLSNSGYMRLVSLRLYENDRLWVRVRE